MRLYYEIAVRSYHRAVMYRGAYIAGMLTNAFFGALMSFVYRAIYASGGSVAGFTVHDAVSYTWVTQSLISVGGAWLSLEIMDTIGSGQVVTDLSRPWNFYGYWLSRTLGERVFNLLARASLTYVFGVVIFGARIPSLVESLAFLVAICLAMLVSFSFNFIVNLTAFWLVDSSGVITVASVTLMFFSGFLLPLAFFPPALQTVARFLPFRAITALPAQIFLGKTAGPDIVGAFLIQIVWAIVLGALSLLLLRAAVRKVVIQGG
jgi:ABC-2 type transport system permease protein